MNKYTISNAITDCGYGATVEYFHAYVEDLEFEAETDELAIEFAEKLQQKHHDEYRKLGASDADCDHGPCYLYSLYRVDSDGDKIKLEI